MIDVVNRVFYYSITIYYPITVSTSSIISTNYYKLTMQVDRRGEPGVRLLAARHVARGALRPITINFHPITINYFPITIDYSITFNDYPITIYCPITIN